MSEYFGFQPAVAARIDDVPEAMQASHDQLIAMAGRYRTSGVTWQIYGSELAGVLARTKTGVVVRDAQTLSSAVSGTLEEGFTLLDDLVELPTEQPLFTPEHDRQAVEDTKAFARAHPDATLVIAYCDLEIRLRTMRVKTRGRDQ